ncbi:MAG: ATP-dependent DNA helicase [Schaedlerella sp.]|nr:ATP-dependent DNA helicase [Schaedlerella sp.]
MEQKIIHISVRNLVEFILREGDIDDRVARIDLDAMQQGSRLHRKIQKRRGSEYQAEVLLKTEILCDGFYLQIEGRADGIFHNDKIVCIEEIKGVVRDIVLIEKPVGVHLAQAKCYAYLYAIHKHLEKISVQMTYCNLENEEEKQFVQEFSFRELEVWFLELVHAYEKWAKFQMEWREKRNKSIRSTEFPFPYREGQRELVSSVYRTILRKKKLFIQAPTGVGKTMATVFPTVRAVGEGLGEKIFYMTAKTITRSVAEQAFQILREKQHLKFKTITLTAKEKICFCEQKNCNPEACPYAKGHFDRVNDAVFELITTENELSRIVLEKQARKYRVCPFEMTLDVSLWVDAIICDYNYVFDPNAHLKRFFSEGGKGEYLFLIDEAHNLVERGREMYSAQVYKEDLLNIKRVVKTKDLRLTKRLEECNRKLLELKRECEEYQILDSVSHIALKYMNILGELERYMEENHELEKREEILDFYFQIRDFLNVYEMLDENYVMYSELESGGKFKIRLFCVNPAVNLYKYLSQGNSTIYFSATLLPIKYYKELLSVEKDDYAIYAKSSFPPENSLLAIGNDVSTKYTRRGEAMYLRFAEYIKEMAESKKGNYIAFFPSYKVLEKVYDCYQKMIGDTVECIVQSQFMGEESREIFLESFEAVRETSLVGFCVMGGIFSEGIDLTEERLIGTAIIGTGLPQVCTEREILKKWFDEKNMSGFDFAYMYPGMNKVLQSAGRVIRTENDRGVILLLDERFLAQRYREVFPREWKEYYVCRKESVCDILKKFWK